MRASSVSTMRRVAVVAVLLSSTGSLAVAQLPNASAAAFGMGGNFTALARGYEAVAWNPANLAMPGRPLFSLGLGILGGSVGLDPIDFRTMSEFSGEIVPVQTRRDWLEQVRLAGGQHVRLDGGLTPIAFSVGPIGFQFGSSMYTNMSLSPDAYEAFVLFGNAGNTGLKDIDLTGTSVRAGAMTAAGMSFAVPIPINLTMGMLANERAAIGVTAKYVMGNALLIAQDNGSVLGANDFDLRFPMILPDSSYTSSYSDDPVSALTTGLGNGVGADVALSWSGGPWKVGMMAENVFSTFRWDTTMLAAISGTGTFNEDSNSVEFDQVAYGLAPAFLREIVANQKYSPGFTVGAAFAVMPSLTLTADMKMSTGGDDAIVVGPRSRLGVGAEWRILPFLPLRAGVASVTDGWQAGAGIGLRLMGYELGLSTSIRRRGQANESGLMIGLVGIGR
ncbi:MAG: hypothetical protein WD801_10600 [Gemmatimonadaceae bacterium]